MTRFWWSRTTPSRATFCARFCVARASRSTPWTTAHPQSNGPASGRYYLVVSDIRMERVGGLDVLRAFTEKAPGTPVILITAFGDVTGAMEAIGHGAYDYVSKPFNVEELRQTVARALERRRLSAEAVARTEDGAAAQVAEIEGKSPRMLDVYKLVARVAPTTATVLVVGESGTGKELVARAIHTRSPRASKPFVPVNCTALSESLLESELFGHARGAFTGAIAAKRGLFEMANGGTLFLDEIGDMGPKMQAQLLRVLQDGECGRWAAPNPLESTCAWCAPPTATSRPRSRRAASAKISTSASTWSPCACRPCASAPVTSPFWCATSWPRSLAARVGPRRASRRKRWRFSVAIPGRETFASWRMPLNARWPWPRATSSCPRICRWKSMAARRRSRAASSMIARPCRELEKRYIGLILAECGGNKKKAAESLGIDRRTLYRALERAGVAAGSDDDGEDE